MSLYEKMLKLDWMNAAFIYSGLRCSTRQKHDVPGTSTIFSVGKPVECPLQEYFSGDWVEDLNPFLNSPDNTFALVTALNLNRKANALIIEALCNSGAKVISEELNIKTLCKILQKDVQGEYYAVVCFQQWEFIKELAKDSANIEEGEPWLGINWKLSSDLPMKDDKRRCFIYKTGAIGFADSGKFKVDITWHGERASHFVNTSLYMGAVTLHPEQIYEIDCKEVVNEIRTDTISNL